MSKIKILAVDDNLIVQKLILASLKEDYDVSIVKDSKELFALIDNLKPDLILLDIMLPEDSGYEICSRLKSNESYSKIPVIFLSSKTGSNARATGYNLGAINYIEKPFQIAELKSIINSTLMNKVVAQDSFSVSNLEVDLIKGSILCAGEQLILTSSEFKLLVLFLKNLNKIYSREELVSIISPQNSDVTPRIIDNFISILRKKISKSSLKFKTIYGKGYKLIKLI